jgi:predicted phosphodiesterase
MRLGIISDLHSNAPALHAALTALDRLGVDEIIALGDLVGYHAMPHETLAALRERRIPSVAGNHDLMVLGRLPVAGTGPNVRRAVEWTRPKLAPREVAELGKLPEALWPAPGMLCVHATLGDPVRRLSSRADITSEAKRLRHHTPTLTLCLKGHDHRQAVHSFDPVLRSETRPGVETVLSRRGFAFIDPGSVGHPRGGDPRAGFAVFDSRRWAVTLHRVDYDRRPLLDADKRAGLTGASRELFAAADASRSGWDRACATVTGIREEIDHLTW